MSPLAAPPQHAEAPSPSRRGRARRRWRLSVPSLVVALIALAGVGIFTYPTAASWFSQYNQSQLIDTYNSEIEAGTDPTAEEQLAKAEEYNDALDSGAELEADERLPTGSGSSTDESLDYWSMLNADSSGMMARLKISSIDVDLPIYHGTSDDTLLQGVGHLEGTSLPVGGDGTHSVLTAHRGLASATMFTYLNEVVVGDTFTIEVFGRVLTYEVIETKVVDPDQTESLLPQEGRDLVTLVTCTPLGINTQRILVTGERVYPTPAEDVADAGTSPDVPTFPWWAVWLAAAVVLAGVYVWRSGYLPVAAGAAAGEGDEGGARDERGDATTDAANGEVDRASASDGSQGRGPAGVEE